MIGAFHSWSAWWNYVSISMQRQAATEANWRDQYNYLRAYYLSNGLYDVLRESFSRLRYSNEALSPLRNPAYRVVEFYAMKLWPGSLPDGLPITTDNKFLVEPIQQIWQWSNWSSEKQAVARTFAMYGDIFIKVATRSANNVVSRVYMQNLEPQTITEFDADERGYLTYVRIDVPQTKRDADGKLKPYTLTEVWDKSDMRFRRWEHEKNINVTIRELGTPTEEKSFANFGIDFIPVIWQPFKHIGDQRGMAAITPALDKIDEANRQATRLHQMLFRYNKPLWAATAGGVDSAGRPFPPPRLGGADGSTLVLNDDPTADDVVRLPGANQLEPLVPNLNYDAALNVIRDQMVEISRDLPEMIYSEIQERSELSGVAIRYLLEAAIDRLIEARGNAEAALIRAHQMAMTIGQAASLFKGLGSYEAGDLEHSFAPRPVLTLPELERAQVTQTYTSAGVPLVTAIRRSGWGDAEIEQMTKEKKEEQEQVQQGLATAMLNAQGNFDRGEQGGNNTDSTEEDVQ